MLSLEPSCGPHRYCDRPSAARPAVVRIAGRCFPHATWLPEGALNRRRRPSLPHSRRPLPRQADLSSPVGTAHQLVRGRPDARLTVVGDSGHKGSATMSTNVRAALDAYAAR